MSNVGKRLPLSLDQRLRLADFRGTSTTVSPHEVRRLREALALSAGTIALADRIAALNPDAGEIGAGMLRQLVDEARRLRPLKDPK